MKQNLMPDVSPNKYPLAELSTIKTTKHVGLYTNEELLLLTSVIEEYKRIKRQMLEPQPQESRRRRRKKK